ncbi:MAG: hypothetical protein IPH58_05250 [Sphingobacteriales bacterium]|nr:hypothetical protein [Sphingobacteriales bacterium]
MTDSVGFGIVAHCDSGLEKNALKKVFLLSFQTELLFPVISNAMQWSEKSLVQNDKLSPLRSEMTVVSRLHSG